MFFHNVLRTQLYFRHDILVCLIEEKFSRLRFLDLHMAALYVLNLHEIDPGIF